MSSLVSREEFILPSSGKLYLAAAGKGVGLKEAVPQFARYMEDRAEGQSAGKTFDEIVSAMRAEVGKLYGAPDSVMLGANVSNVMKVLSEALGLGPRDIIITARTPYAATWFNTPAQIAEVAPSTEAYLHAIERYSRIASRHGGRLFVFAEAVVPSTCLKLDIPLIFAAVEAAEGNATLMVDASQWWGQIDAKSFAHIIWGSAAKWPLGVRAMGWAWINVEHLPIGKDETLRPTVADTAARHTHWSGVATLELGEVPIPAIYASLPGLQRINGLGLDIVAARSADMVGRLTERLLAGDVRLRSSADPLLQTGNVCLDTSSEAAAKGLCVALEEAGVLASVGLQQAPVRFTPWVYTSDEDLDTAAEVAIAVAPRFQ